LTDEQWTKIEPLIPRQRPGPKGILGDRNFVDAVVFRLKTGVPWRDLPQRFGPWKSIYNRFNNWAKAGVWTRIFEEIRELDPDDASIIDASIVRAHQSASGGKGGSKRTASGGRGEGSRPRSTRSPTREGDRNTLS